MIYLLWAAVGFLVAWQVCFVRHTNRNTAKLNEIIEDTWADYREAKAFQQTVAKKLRALGQPID